MKLSLLRTVRSRLLALMAFIVIPIAILSIIIASINYRSITKNIKMSHVEATSNYIVRTRIWFRGALRALTVTSLSTQTNTPTEATCNAALNNVIDSGNGFQAIQIYRSDNIVCYSSSILNMNSDIMSQISKQHLSSPESPVINMADKFQYRYDSYFFEDKLYFVISTRDVRSADNTVDTIALIDTKMLNQIFEIGQVNPDSIFALMKGENEILVSRGVEKNDKSWLPKNLASLNQNYYWQTEALSGSNFTYVRQPLSDQDIYILARFTGDSAQAAYTQFLILCMMPLLILVILFMTYAWTIQSDVIKWIRGIESAAKGQDGSTSRIAPIDNAMPDDIRAVAEAFNNMVTEADKRETALRTTIDANGFLTRELNHRVKNSLQVIQSYLALSRRQHRHGPTDHLAETEAKVQVLSTAYRLALQDGVMRPVSIKPFSEEILESVASSFRRKGQWIDVHIEATSGLVVDHVIALGLVLVEGVMACIRGENCNTITVRLTEQDDGYLSLLISSDGNCKSSLPPPKIMAGLAAQINATVQETEEGEIIKWIFKP